MLKDFGMNILVILWLLFCGVIDYLKIFCLLEKRLFVFWEKKLLVILFLLCCVVRRIHPQNCVYLFSFQSCHLTFNNDE